MAPKREQRVSQTIIDKYCSLAIEEEGLKYFVLNTTPVLVDTDNKIQKVILGYDDLYPTLTLNKVNKPLVTVDVITVDVNKPCHTGDKLGYGGVEAEHHADGEAEPKIWTEIEKLLDEGGKSKIQTQKDVSCEEQESNIPTRSVLFIGESGTGKTLAINAMINYIFDVRQGDNFRFMLVDKNSKYGTYASGDGEFITMYNIHYLKGMNHRCNFCFIDTPGLAEGRRFDHLTMIDQLQTFLMQNYVDDLNCICLTVKADAKNDTSHKNKMLKKTLALLSRNFPGIIPQLFATFAVDTPTVGNILSNSGIEFGATFSLENSILFNNQLASTVADSETNELRWKNMQEQYNCFLLLLEVSKPTRNKFLQEKEDAENVMALLRKCTKQLENIWRVIKKSKESQRELLSQMEENREFVKFVNKPVKTKYSLEEHGCHIHKCSVCNMTCLACKTVQTDVTVRKDSIVYKILAVFFAVIYYVFGYSFNSESTTMRNIEMCPLSRKYVGPEGMNIKKCPMCHHNLKQHKKITDTVSELAYQTVPTIDENIKRRYMNAQKKLLKEETVLAKHEEVFLSLTKKTLVVYQKAVIHARELREVKEGEGYYDKEIREEMVGRLPQECPEIITWFLLLLDVLSRDILSTNNGQFEDFFYMIKYFVESRKLC